MPSLLEVPDWLKDHPDLRYRGIKLHMGIKPVSVIQSSTVPAYSITDLFFSTGASTTPLDLLGALSRNM